MNRLADNELIGAKEPYQTPMIKVHAIEGQGYILADSSQTVNTETTQPDWNPDETVTPGGDGNGEIDL